MMHPGSGALVIMGISPRLSSHDDELRTAHEDAARKASMYNGVWATVESIQNIGAGFFDYYVASETRVEYDQNLGPYMARLSYDPKKDVSRNQDGALFVRFTYPAAFPGNIRYNFGKNSDGSPEWTTRQPTEISGYAAGVGRSGRLSSFNNTVLKAYEAAAANIASRVSNELRAVDTMVQSSAESQIHSFSSGRLRNFLVLEIWIDPSTRAVWTLAVAQPQD